jgi:exoribonuclease R
VSWPDHHSHAEFVRALDPAVPRHAAVLAETTVLLRGSGYLAFDGDAPVEAKHAGVGAPYAHTTAPLRRLVDRYVGEVCVAVCAGEEVPEWARAALPQLPETMERSNGRAQQYGAGIVSIVEAAVLAPYVGRVFDAVVVETDERGGVVQLTDPAVSARCEGDDLPLGERVDVRLTLADVAKRQVRFQLA